MKLKTYTNWSVLTGPPCSGKTELINFIKSMGHTISSDVSRLVIAEANKDICTMKRIKDSPLFLQEKILAEMVRVESLLDIKTLTFLEYALPCNLAFCEKDKVFPRTLLESAMTYDYKNIFYCEPFKYVKDEVRNDDKAYQMEIGLLIKKHYELLGYNIVTLPPTNPTDRYSIICKYIK